MERKGLGDDGGQRKGLGDDGGQRKGLGDDSLGDALGCKLLISCITIYFHLFCSKQCTPARERAKSPHLLVLSDTAGRMG